MTRRGLAITIAAVMLAGAAHAQGLVQGVEKGARDGNRAAGPVGGVLGGAIGGVVGIVGGVLGVPANPQPRQPEQAQPVPAANERATPAQTKAAKAKAAKDAAKTTKAAKAAPLPPSVPTPQPAAPLTAEQIMAASDANIARIKTELKLTPEQDKYWGGFNSAMRYLGSNGAERLNLRVARAKRDPPDDIVEQMRNEAQFLNDRAVDQRAVADAAEPLFVSLDERQKAVFIAEMVKLSRERGLD